MKDDILKGEVREEMPEEGEEAIEKNGRKID